MTLANIGEMLREILASVKQAPALAQEIAEVKATAADLTAKLSASADEVAELKSALAAKDAEIANAQASATASAAEVLAANAAKATAEAALKDLSENPSKQALEIVAMAGVKPGARPAASAADRQTITRAAFDAMSYTHQREHVQSVEDVERERPRLAGGSADGAGIHK